MGLSTREEPDYSIGGDGMDDEEQEDQLRNNYDDEEVNRQGGTWQALPPLTS